jgi:SAM-dependent methyltransferase
MCDSNVLEFVAKTVRPDDVAGKSVLDVGALDVNGSVRPHLESLRPSRYVGVDLAPGPCVDEICDVAELVHRFGRESFDLVVSTEMIEHVEDWRTALEQMKLVLKPGGTLVLTTRSIGFPPHGYPYDFWRYQREDMETILADFADVQISRDDPDGPYPGVLAYARKPSNWRPVDLSAVALYSIITRRRTRNVGPFAIAAYKAAWGAQRRLPQSVWNLVKRVLYR